MDMIKAVKHHYIKLLSSFLDEIKEIEDNFLKSLPALHIPIIGNGYENAKVKFAFYGIETYGRIESCNMLDLKNNLLESPEKGYDYLTNVSIPEKINKWAKPKGGSIFFKYLISLLGAFYNIDAKHLREEDELSNIPFIWGNLHSLEMFQGSPCKRGVPYETYLKVKAASKMFDEHSNNISYITKTCKPNVLIILTWAFNSKYWLKKEFKIEPEKLADHLFYAYIPELNTNIYKHVHPRYIKQILGWDKSIKTIVDDLKNHLK
jgi:hypothetical protein